MPTNIVNLQATSPFSFILCHVGSHVLAYP